MRVQGDVPRRWIVLVWIAHATAAGAGSLPRLPGMPGMYMTTTRAALPMLDSTIDVTVRGPIVETTVTQTFRNDTDSATEATYIFPLPADAAVSAMAIDLGTRTIHAAVERRDRAQARYEEAVAAGMGAGMLEEERPDVFTQTVSAIPAHGTVAVTLRYDATAHYGDGIWQLVVPLVVAPRYVPGTPSGRPTTGSGHNPDTERAPDASRVTPHAAPNAGGASRISIAFLTAVDDVTSPTHELALATARYTVVDPHSDHDLIVRWRSKVPAEGWVESERSGSGFAAALVTGPAAAPHAATRLRFVLDRAATTRGDGDAVERALVRALLGALDAKDRAGLATGELHGPAELLHALDEGWARGNAVFDLTRVLASARPNGAPLVLVSDGLVADDAAAIAAAKQVGVPIYVVGIGPAPNRSLLAAIAAATGGTVRFALAGDDLAALARDVISDAANPPAALAVSWGTLAASDVVPARLPRLGAGQATLVLARVKRPAAANARAGGDVFALASFRASPAPAGATTPHGALARRWARLELDELLARGNPRAITEHALAWGLVSPYTAMVAIGDEVVVAGGVKHTRGVPVSLPAGMQWQPVKHETTFELDTTKQVKTEVDATSDAKPKKRPARDRDTVSEDQDVPRQTKKHAGGPATSATPATPAGGAPRGGDLDGVEAANGTGDASGASDDESRPEPAESVALSDRAPTIDDRELQGEAVAASYGGRYLRLELALGGGVAVVNGDGRFVSTTRLGFETGRRTLFGAEGTLWLGRALSVEGTLLGTITRRQLAPHTELGAGIGLHLGSDVGPALELMLRYALPVRPLWLYLRYDGALLFHGDVRDGQNTGTVGIEAHF